mgnify:CR=1 FL=1
MTENNGVDYLSSGVDLDAAERVKAELGGLVSSTGDENTLSPFGLFGGLYAVPDSFSSPILVASADGVGTKLKVACITGRHNTIGQCLVNHCTNDILAVGARPLFFLDYFAAGKLDVDIFEEVISGLSKSCRENDCALIGGETAEMPDFYKPGDYDISGTIVGVTEKGEMMPNRGVNEGDLLIGLPSTGLHTNGYSLARKVLLEHYDSDDFVESLDTTIGKALLAIHKSYLPVIDSILHENWLVGISHITGGGIVENTHRVLSDNQDISIDWESWEWPSIFKLIQKCGNIPTEDMIRPFNLGIGLILIIDKENLPDLDAHLNQCNEKYVVLGEVYSK